jgi:hypothetical protein
MCISKTAWLVLGEEAEKKPANFNQLNNINSLVASVSRKSDEL